MFLLLFRFTFAQNWHTQKGIAGDFKTNSFLDYELSELYNPTLKITTGTATVLLYDVVDQEFDCLLLKILNG